MFSNFMGGSRSGVSKMLSDKNTPVEALLHHEDLYDHIRDCAYKPQLKRVAKYVQDNLPKLIKIALKDPSPSSEVVQTGDPNTSMASQQDLDIMASVNATEMIMKAASFDPMLVDMVVPSAVSVLKRSTSLHSATCQNINQLMASFFSLECTRTISAINATLDSEIAIGAIRHLTASVVIGETLLGLFGTLLEAATSLELESVDEFTREWITNMFPFHFASYIKIAMSDINSVAYFTFFQDLLARGLTRALGPMLDALFEEQTVTTLIELVCEGCEESDGGMDTSPLAADAVSVLTSIVMLTRESYPPIDTEAEYATTISNCAPLRAMILFLPRFVKVLGSDNCMAQALDPNALGFMRLNIVELVSELFRIHRQEIDEAILLSGFYEQLLSLVQRFPDHDILLQSFSRIAIETTKREYPNLLLNRFAEGNSYLRLLYSFMTEEQFLTKALRSHCLSIAMYVKEAALLLAAPAASEVFSQIDEVVQPSVAQWVANITGEKFEEVGSWNPDIVVHRDVVNPMDLDLNPSSPVIVVGENDSIKQEPCPAFTEDSHEFTGSRANRYTSASFDEDEDEDESPDATGFVVERPDSAGEWGFRMWGADEAPPPVPVDDDDDGVNVGEDEEGNVWVERTIQEVSDALRVMDARQAQPQAPPPPDQDHQGHRTENGHPQFETTHLPVGTRIEAPGMGVSFSPTFTNVPPPIEENAEPRVWEGESQDVA